MLMKINPKTIEENVFYTVAEDKLLLTAGTKDHCNCMTAGWAQVGILWRKNVATVYVRPQRYTYEFLEGSDYFSISVLDDDHNEAHEICGSKSGRDLNKFQACGLTVAEGADGAAYVQESNLVLVCRKLYWYDVDPTHIQDKEIVDAFYQNGGFHRAYVGEILEAYRKG